MRYQRIYIEITNVCNLKCSFCLESKRSARFMSLSEFEHILKEIDDSTDHIYLHVKGEPTLHPQLNEIMDIAGQYHKKVHLVTNGTQLNQLNFNIVNHPALAQLSISLHSLEDMNTQDKEIYLDRLEKIIMRSVDGLFTIYLRIWNENNTFLLNWLKKTLMINFEYAPNKHRIKLSEHIILDFDKSFVWPSLNDPYQTNQGHCYGGLKMMAILVDGSLTPCCLDTDGDMVIGNIFQHSFKDLLNQERYTSFIKHLNKNQLNESLCQHCTYHLKHKKRLV